MKSRQRFGYNNVLNSSVGLLCGMVLMVAAHAQSPSSKARLVDAAAIQALSGPMVPIPGGSFRMGDLAGVGQAKEKPAHDVTVKPFRIGQYDVTVGQFRAFVNASGYRTEAERDVAKTGCVSMEVSTDKWVRAGATWLNPGYEQTDRHPVSCVSWNDAQAYIAWLNAETRGHFRLPTEAEWEYAARAGTTTLYFWGSEMGKGCEYANGADQTPWPNGTGNWKAKMECNDRYFYAAPVGSYKPNPFGLYDMVGNMWQWVQDCWHESYEGAPTDGSAWEGSECRGRMSRGGSWHSAPGLRISGREWGDHSRIEYGNQGFRLAQDF